MLGVDALQTGVTRFAEQRDEQITQDARAVPGEDLKRVVARRKADHEVFRRLPAFSRLVFAGAPFDRHHANVDAVDVGRYQADQTERWLRRAAEFRSGPAASDVTLVDLQYRDLVGDPVAAITRVYEAAGLDAPSDPAGFIDAYHRSQPRHAHGTHRYRASDFGLDEHELRERFDFLQS